MTAGEDRKWEHAFEQLSHLWSTPRFLFLPFAIGMGEAASEDKPGLLEGFSGDSSLRICKTLPCVGLPMRASEADPMEAELWWADGGDDERDKDASDSAAAVAGLRRVSNRRKKTKQKTYVGRLAASLASLSLLLVLPVEERRLWCFALWPGSGMGWALEAAMERESRLDEACC